jgi:hypothetical protein
MRGGHARMHRFRAIRERRQLESSTLVLKPHRLADGDQAR